MCHIAGVGHLCPRQPRTLFAVGFSITSRSFGVFGISNVLASIAPGIIRPMTGSLLAAYP